MSIFGLPCQVDNEEGYDRCGSESVPYSRTTPRKLDLRCRVLLALWAAA